MTTTCSQEKWTDITRLPEWEEEFYDVYTARKHNKWVMLKTLKPAYKYNDQYRAMLDKEFEVRYNLAHPNIVMINDLDDVPGLGRCIITDDVYGDSLRKLIDRGQVTAKVIDKLCHQLVDAIDYIQTLHLVHYPIKPETIIFTENIGNLKLIDVGFDQKNHLEPAEAADDIECFGKVLMEACNACPDADRHIRSVAERCMGSRRYRDVHELRMALAQRSEKRLYTAIIIFLSLMIILLAWLSSPYKPNP